MTRISRNTRSFWLIAVANGVLLFGSAAPSPLYPIYQRLWGFSVGMLTVIFAAYVVGLIASLLTLGALSDHVGRKPVLVGAFLLVIGSMIVFAKADGTVTLLIARLVQGLGTGAALGALSAALVDLQPSARIGSLVAGVAPVLGLACGIVGSAMLVQFGPDPRALVYVLLSALLAALAAATLTIVPETSPRHGFASRRHALRAMKPRIAIPPEVRSPFLAGTPALIAVWALGGLILSLGSSVISVELGIGNVAVGGLILASFFFCATAAAPLAGSSNPRMSLPMSYLSLAVGLGLELVGSLGDSVAAYTAGLVISGVGFSTAYVGVIASVAHVAPAARGQLFATLYVIAYSAFSVPAVIAGFVATYAGLDGTVTGYTIFVLVMVAVAAIAIPLRARVSTRRAAAGTAPQSICLEDKIST
jgi:MFS family permease